VKSGVRWAWCFAQGARAWSSRVIRPRVLRSCVRLANRIVPGLGVLAARLAARWVRGSALWPWPPLENLPVSYKRPSDAALSLLQHHPHKSSVYSTLRASSYFLSCNGIATGVRKYVMSQVCEYSVVVCRLELTSSYMMVDRYRTCSTAQCTELRPFNLCAWIEKILLVILLHRCAARQ
jgi:hypothetical protein